MCPDIETYAPLIVAGFGLGSWPRKATRRTGCGAPGRPLPHSDQPAARCGKGVAEHRGGRATATEVLDRARGAGAGALRVHRCQPRRDYRVVRESGIRWGFDKEQRAPYGLDHILHNTWRFGLDRILTGVAMSDDSQAWLDTALPLDDVGSNKVELAGRLAEYVHGCERGRVAGRIPTSDEWIDALTERCRRAHQGGAAANARWPRYRAGPPGVRKSAGTGGFSCIDGDAAARRPCLLAGRLAGRPTRASFRTGTLTVCTLVPMRSVPHRVVCLMGMDDGVFPRHGLIDGDDVLARVRSSVSATCAARIGSCSSTRSARRRSAWSSPTPAPIRAAAPMSAVRAAGGVARRAGPDDVKARAGAHRGGPSVAAVRRSQRRPSRSWCRANRSPSTRRRWWPPRRWSATGTPRARVSRQPLPAIRFLLFFFFFVRVRVRIARIMHTPLSGSIRAAASRTGRARVGILP